MVMQLTITDLSKRFPTSRGETLALRNISLMVRSDEFLCVVGPSGCGKSTLLRLIAHLIEPSSGSMTYEGQDIPPSCAMVFQDSGLFPWLSVVDNVAFGLETRGVRSTDRRERSMRQLDRMGLSGFAHHYPHELSGGMRQRVAIARALVTDPGTLLMDEPFRALDAQTRLMLQGDLLGVWRERARMVVFVTHDIEEAILLGDRILVMSGRPGRVLAELSVPLEKPRDLTGRSHPEIEEMRWHIWKLLEPEVQRAMQSGVPGF